MATKAQNWTLLESKAHVYLYPLLPNLPVPGAQHWSHSLPGGSEDADHGPNSKEWDKMASAKVGQARELGSWE